MRMEDGYSHVDTMTDTELAAELRHQYRQMLATKDHDNLVAEYRFDYAADVARARGWPLMPADAIQAVRAEKAEAKP